MLRSYTYDGQNKGSVAAPLGVDNVFELEKYAGTPADEAYRFSWLVAQRSGQQHRFKVCIFQNNETR